MKLSVIGIVISVLILLPNIVFYKKFSTKNVQGAFIIDVWTLFPNIMFSKKFPPKNIPESTKDVPIVFIIMELIGQWDCFGNMIFSNGNLKLNNINAFMILMIICILIYYGLWIRYILHGQDFLFLWKPFLYIPIPLGVFPVFIFGFAALLGNYISLGISTVIFAIGHFTVGWNSYKKVTENNIKAS